MSASAGYRALAASVIQDAIKLTLGLRKTEALYRKAKERGRAPKGLMDFLLESRRAKRWLLSSQSNLKLFAGTLGHSPDFYRRHTIRLLEEQKEGKP